MALCSDIGEVVVNVLDSVCFDVRNDANGMLLYTPSNKVKRVFNRTFGNCWKTDSRSASNLVVEMTSIYEINMVSVRCYIHTFG